MVEEIVYDEFDRAVLAVDAKADSVTSTEGVRLIQELSNNFESYESPIDINLTKTLPLQLPEINWHHTDLAPKKMKCTNTGHTLIVSAKWLQERPYLSGGPFRGKYVFSQLHFHWGKDNMEGSEHTVDGTPHPLEMHVVYFKSCYLTQEASLKKRDGMAVLAYFFKLQEVDNPKVQILINALLQVQKPHKSIKLDPPLPLNFIVRPFKNDYYCYWGSVTTTACIHLILWLLSRQPIGISIGQCEQFRTMIDANDKPLLSNFRELQIRNPSNPVFHCNPSRSTYSTLLPIPLSEQARSKKKDMDVSSTYHVQCDNTGPFQKFSTKLNNEATLDVVKEEERERYKESTGPRVRSKDIKEAENKIRDRVDKDKLREPNVLKYNTRIAVSPNMLAKMEGLLTKKQD